MLQFTELHSEAHMVRGYLVAIHFETPFTVELQGPYGQKELQPIMSNLLTVRGYALSMGNCNLIMQKILSRTIGGCVFRELQFPFTLKTSYLDFKKKSWSVVTGT
jgi:hypothetical protein